MKKTKYQKPKIEILEITLNDILTVSSNINIVEYQEDSGFKDFIEW